MTVEFKTIPLSKVKKGEFVRLKGKQRVYVYSCKDRKYGYELQAWDDASYFRYFKKDIEVEVGFEF